VGLLACTSSEWLLVICCWLVHLVNLPCRSRFEEYAPIDEFDNKCYEVTAVFSISAFQYIGMAVIFSKGSPYRKNMFTNCKFSELVHKLYEQIVQFVSHPFYVVATMTLDRWSFLLHISLLLLIFYICLTYHYWQAVYFVPWVSNRILI